jgi:signal transduction histidine kinase
VSCGFISLPTGDGLVLWADVQRRVVPRLGSVIRDELRALWAEPRVPDPPVRVWRDWGLLAAGLTGTLLEAVLRKDVVWLPVSVLITVGLCLTTLWRRTHPLAMVALAFGAGILLTLVDHVAGHVEPVGLYSGLIILALVYALPRWGSGRDIVLGSALILTAFVLSVVADDLPVGDQVGGFVFLTFPGVIGASVRFWSTSRTRELERMRSREREEFARELHDTVAHHVSAIVIRAQAGRVVTRANPAAALEALEGIEEEGARTLEAMRAMVVALRDGNTDAHLAPQAGVADLERLARAPGGGPRIDLRLDGALDDLPPAVDAAVYRIVQESVTNANRHAVDATEIVVRVTAEPDRVRLTVRDDGAGPGRGHHRDGYGLAGLHERATLLGGTLHAGPCPDRGWLVEAQLPRGRVGGHGHPGPRR